MPEENQKYIDKQPEYRYHQKSLKQSWNEHAYNTKSYYLSWPEIESILQITFDTNCIHQRNLTNLAQLNDYSYPYPKLTH